MRTNRSEKSEARRDALDSRLSGYSAGAKVAAAARKLRSRTGNWPVYAAAAGSALAMTTSASASIISGVYPGTGPHGGVSVRPQPGSASSVKGLLFGLGEINIKAQSGSNNFGHFTNFSAEGILPLKIFEAGSYGQYAKNFAAGGHISAAAGVLAASGARIAKAVFSASSVGSFLPGAPGYVGFALDQGGGNINYGWLKLEFSFDPQTTQGVLEALGFGYETTAGKAIAAGDTGGTATPEPGTMALGILAAGAAGVVALRRRRQAA
ncbi:MAG TPA: PEP-CTERM sorting domain-containing protein [Bryobacteraceae bacterium]